MEVIKHKVEYEEKRKILYKRPEPDVAAYNEVMKRGFKRFPNRFENYRIYKSYKNSWADEKGIKFMPVKMDIEPNSRCNFKCRMCLVSEFKKGGRAKDLGIEDFRYIIDRQFGLIELKLQGLGEPFMNKDFVKMVEYAHEKDIWVRTTTNGSLLHINQNYKRIVDAGIGEIQISVDGSCKETYEYIRKKGTFELLVENCKLINSYCDVKGRDRTRMWVLLQKDNIHELSKFPEFAKELGFKRVTVSLDVNGFGNQKWLEKNQNKNVSGTLSQENIDILMAEALKLDIDLSFWDISAKYSKSKLCPWPFERVYISSDLRIVPCCMIGNPGIVDFGNAREFEEIWFGNRYQVFRKKHREVVVPDYCKSCYERDKGEIDAF